MSRLSGSGSGKARQLAGDAAAGGGGSGVTSGVGSGVTSGVGSGVTSGVGSGVGGGSVGGADTSSEGDAAGLSGGQGRAACAEPSGVGIANDGVTPLASGVGTGKQVGDGLGSPHLPATSRPHDEPNGWKVLW